jgi:hypothetical protein
MDHPDAQRRALADLLLDWIPDPTLRNRVLADNPAVLYGWK